MSYRTFFLIGHCNFSVAPPGFYSKQSITYVDVSEGLVVEQVAARMDGVRLTHQMLAEAFPDATSAARGYITMQNTARTDDTLRGPFRIHTEYPPEEAELVQWFVDTYHTFANAPRTPNSRIFAPHHSGALEPLEMTKLKGARGRTKNTAA